MQPVSLPGLWRPGLRWRCADQPRPQVASTAAEGRPHALSFSAMGRVLVRQRALAPEPLRQWPPPPQAGVLLQVSSRSAKRPWPDEAQGWGLRQGPERVSAWS